MKKRRLSLSAWELMPAGNTVQSLQESTAHCTRCNACVQSCPAYVLRKEEIFSPRGRAQLTRSLVEGKIKMSTQDTHAQEMVRSCFLCAQCSGVCAARIPVAHYMLAFHRAQHLPVSSLMKACLYVRQYHPALFDKLVRTVLLLRKTGLISLFQWLLPEAWKHLHHIVPKHPQSLRHLVKKIGIISNPAAPKALYLPSGYAYYLDGQTGIKIFSLLKHAQTKILFPHSSGLAEYILSSKARSLLAAKKIIHIWEKQSGKKPLPLLTDNVEDFLFLKNYPWLFAGISNWKNRAEQFAAHVQFIVDFAYPKTKSPSEKKISSLFSSSILFSDPAIIERAQKILQTHLGKNFVECEYGGFRAPHIWRTFLDRFSWQPIRKQLAQEIAQRQIETVYCLSGWTALELNAILNQYYPGTRAKHFVYIKADYERVQKRKS